MLVIFVFFSLCIVGCQFKGITGGGRVDTANMTINSLVATIGAY